MLAVGPIMGQGSTYVDGNSQARVMGGGRDVAEDGLLHFAALLHLISRWVGDEVVLVARLLWALLTRDVGPLRGESRKPLFPRAALLEVPPSDLDLCLAWCLGM